MDKVVYVLGAGFSAPLGLPVMSNFIIKAKDMYFKKPEKYGYFKSVFDTINQASVIKNIFQADLFNIEEVLSVLEMNEFLNKKNKSSTFKQFIADVIGYYTPKIKPYPEALPGNWYDFIFGEDEIWRMYGAFSLSLLNLNIVRPSRGQSYLYTKSNLDISYSVVSLNYDMVIEEPFNFVSNQLSLAKKIEINEDNDSMYGDCCLDITKLHGSIDKMNIVPPTWNKYSNKDLKMIWKKAHKLLASANHIRILGYSLPVSDSYIKYFLKSALLESQHLKSIDVICRDPFGDVKRQYDDFIDFKYYKFKDGDIVDLLKTNLQFARKQKEPALTGIAFDQLEEAHRAFMHVV